MERRMRCCRRAIWLGQPSSKKKGRWWEAIGPAFCVVANNGRRLIRSVTIGNLGDCGSPNRRRNSCILKLVTMKN